MRERYRRWYLCKVYVDDALVRVCRRLCKPVVLLTKRYLSVLVGNLVYGENAVLGAALDSHIAYGESVVRAHVLDALSAELYALIQRAVYAYHADDVQYYVFTADIRRWLAY